MSTQSTQVEMACKTLAEDILISTYVPEAELLTREEAIKLAIQRDEEAAATLHHNAMEVAEKERQEKIDLIMKDLGYNE